MTVGNGHVIDPNGDARRTLLEAVSERGPEVLSDAATELSAELPEGRVQVLLAGDDVQLSYVEDAQVPAEEGEGGDPSARITLRLSEGLKARVEESAVREGVSINTFIIRALDRGTGASRPTGRVRGGNRLRGYGST